MSRLESLIVAVSMALGLAWLVGEVSAYGASSIAPRSCNLIVTGTGDSGLGTLRDTLGCANTGDTVTFSLPGNSIIAVTNQLTVVKSVIVDGSAVPNLTISGGGLTRIFSITVPATFVSVTIANGSADSGSAINTTSGLTLTNVSVIDNTTTNAAFGRGGGVLATGAVVLNGGVFRNNQCSNSICFGGGLFTFGSLTMTGTQFISNTATFAAGGAYAGGATILTNGIFRDNECTNLGCTTGGLYTNGPVTCIAQNEMRQKGLRNN